MADEKETKKTEKKSDSPEKTAYRLLIENYKKKNPVKYEAKKAVLESRLNAL